MKIFKKGFTIAEVLICFTVIGVIAALLIPAIVQKKPNKNKVMFRKSYYIVERIVAELIADEETFPADFETSKALAYFDPTSSDRLQADTGKFFCNRFASKLSTNGDIKCDVAKKLPDNGTAFAEGDQSFTTNDGVYWFVTPSVLCDPEDAVNNPGESCKMPEVENPPCPTAVGDKQPYICLFLDVNGPDIPNTQAVDGTNNDRFRVYVYYNGKIQVPTDDRSAEYLKSTTVF